MRTLRPTVVPLLLAAALTPSVAGAHVHITSHETRDGMFQIKVGPCGAAGSTRGEVVHTFEAGETITLTFDEYIPHPGYYRISFDDDGQDDFVDPADYNDFYTNDTVLVDNLYPHENSDVDGDWTYDLTLPDVVCDNCTLQLVQMMTDKPPYVPGTNDLYYNCLDIVLTEPAGEDAGGVTDAGQSDVGVSSDAGQGDVSVNADGGSPVDASGDAAEPPISDADSPDSPDASGHGDTSVPDGATGGSDEETEREESAGGCASSPAPMSGAMAFFVALLATRRRRPQPRA